MEGGDAWTVPLLKWGEIPGCIGSGVAVLAGAAGLSFPGGVGWLLPGPTGADVPSTAGGLLCHWLPGRASVTSQAAAKCLLPPALGLATPPPAAKVPSWLLWGRRSRFLLAWPLWEGGAGECAEQAGVKWQLAAAPLAPCHGLCEVPAERVLERGECCAPRGYSSPPEAKQTSPSCLA